MDVSLYEQLQFFAQELYRNLSPEILHKFAKDVGFVRRTSKYSGNDQVYGSQCINSLEEGDVRIGDLGYFSLEDFRAISEKEAYFPSRLKLNMRVYYKNPNPEIFRNGTIKKHSEYIQIDVEQLLDTLQPGETKEFSDVYVGMYTNEVNEKRKLHK